MDLHCADVNMRQILQTLVVYRAGRLCHMRHSQRGGMGQHAQNDTQRCVNEQTARYFSLWSLLHSSHTPELS